MDDFVQVLFCADLRVVPGMESLSPTQPESEDRVTTEIEKKETDSKNKRKVQTVFQLVK